jgi:hypothetical protein
VRASLKDGVSKSQKSARGEGREEEWEVGGMGCMHVKVVGKERERRIIEGRVEVRVDPGG